MSLDVIWALCFPPETTVLPFLCQFFSEHRDEIILFLWTKCTELLKFCFHLDFQLSFPLSVFSSHDWAHHPCGKLRQSVSIVSHFYFPCVLHCWRTSALLPQALWDQSPFSFGSAKISSVPLFLYIISLSNLLTDLLSFLWLSLQSSLEWKSVFSHFTLFGT